MTRWRHIGEFDFSRSNEEFLLSDGYNIAVDQFCPMTVNDCHEAGEHLMHKNLLHWAELPKMPDVCEIEKRLGDQND